MLSWIEASVVVTIMALGVMVYLLRDAGKQLNWFKSTAHEPIKYIMQTDDAATFDEALKYFHLLSFNEKLRIIQTSFGRPIRIVSGLDKDGAWLETITYYEPTEGDANYHLNKQQQKYGGIG